ncbi:single-stranded DNA-binding protein [Microbacterium aurum]
MTTRIPVTLEGNLTSDPEHGASDGGIDWARFTIAVNERRLNETTRTWEDAGTVFHRVAVFNQQAHHVVSSLRKGDTVIVSGELRFGNYIDKETGKTRETRDVIADNVGASLKFADVGIQRAPKTNGPAATGPVVAPAATAGAGFAR